MVFKKIFGSSRNAALTNKLKPFLKSESPAKSGLRVAIQQFNV
jgi:hypothetical protein